MESQNSMMLEDYEEFISLTLRTGNSKKPSRMLVRNWKHQWLPLCLARQARKVSMVRPVARQMISNQKFACILEAGESTRLRMGESLPDHHEDHIAGKGENSLQHYNLFLCLKPWRFPQQKQRWTRNVKNWRKFRRGTWRKSEVRSDRWSKDVGRYSSFCIINGHMSSEKCWIGGKAPKIQRSSCPPRWYCKRQFWFLCSIHWTRFFSISNDSSQDHGYHLQIAWLRRTSSRRSISFYPNQNGWCSQIIENSKIGVSRHLDSSTTTQMAKIMVQYGRPSCSSWTTSVRSSFGRTIMGKAIWESPIETRLGEGFQLGMLIRTP